MRLRLTIRRHGLPDTQILWSTRGLHSTTQENSSKPTIAQLLHQVNEVIPLEATEWGLEDYVVEVLGFECVHFAALESVLKEDDAVVIRPLELNDRRSRRVSGRTQISADGRRLYDGVAFGRSFIRTIPRPPIRIPSVKRPRITYDSDVDEDQDTPNQLVLREDTPDDDEDDSDYEQVLSQTEIEELAEEAIRHQQGAGNPSLSRNGKRRRTGLGIKDIKVSPSERNDTSATSSSRAHGSSFSPKNVRFENDELDTPVTVLDMDLGDDESDGDFASEDDLDDSQANKENVAPSRASRRQGSRLRGLVSDPVVSTSSGSSEDSSSGYSNTNSPKPSTFEQLKQRKSPNIRTEMSHSSCSSNSSTSDSSETTSSSGSESSDEDSEEDSSDVDSSSDSESSSASSQRSMGVVNTITAPKMPQKVVIGTMAEARKVPANQTPPGQGRQATKRRNARRRLKKHMDLQNARERETAEKNTREVASIEHEDHATSKAEEDLENRKAALLQGLRTSNDRHVEDAQQPPQVKDYAMVNGVQPDTTLTSIPNEYSQPSQEPPDELSSKQPIARHQSSAMATVEEPSSIIEASPKETPSRRRKLDLGGAQRMLFGSLGLRAPKSKDEADKMRSRLEAKAQKLPGSVVGKELPTVNDTSAIPPEKVENDQSWMDKIDLRAVECCYEGITYTAPPFPFVQRWDPQQQGTKRKSKRAGGGGGKGKRQKRNNKQFYQGDYDEVEYNDYYEQEQGEQSYLNGNVAIEDVTFNTTLDQTMQSDPDQQAAAEQLIEESQKEATADKDPQAFPELPSDMTTLPKLTTTTAAVGSIIAFKQMQMSQSTGWCPVISDYKTAKIESVFDNGILNLFLSAKDLPQDDRQYDIETGERIYTKFEMPDDDENDQDDHLEIGLEDMIDPRLVKAPESSESLSFVVPGVADAVEGVMDIVAAGQELLGNVFSASDRSADVSAGDTTALDAANTSMVQDKEDTIEDPEMSGPIPSANDVEMMDSKSTMIREASVELGSQNPPRRFFSELNSSQITDSSEEHLQDEESREASPIPKATQDYDGYVAFDTGDDNRVASESNLDEEDDHEASSFEDLEAEKTTMADDPSVWTMEDDNLEQNVSEELEHVEEHEVKQEGEKTEHHVVPEDQDTTQYYSLVANEGSVLSEPLLDTDEEAPDMGAPRFHNLDEDKDNISGVEHESTSNHSSSPAVYVSKAIFNQEDLEEETGEAGEDTFTQESIGPKHDVSKKIHWPAEPADEDLESESDSDSGSSLPSLHAILSQPVVHKKSLEVSTTQIKNGKEKIASTAPPTIKPSNAMNKSSRIPSDTHKMLADEEPFLGSSDVEAPAGPYEMAADHGSPFASEDDDLSLPNIHEKSDAATTPRKGSTLFRAGPFKTRSSSQNRPLFTYGTASTRASRNSRDSQGATQVVDLTLSSDPLVPDDDREERYASTMPTGEASVDKSSTKSRGKGKAKATRKTYTRSKSSL